MRFITLLIPFLITACGYAKFKLSPENQGFSYKPEYAAKVDIVFIVDNSSSMQDHQEILAQSTTSFLRLLRERELDYQIAVTTTDMSKTGSRGKFIGQPAVMDQTTPSIEGQLRSRLVAGTEGSSSEQGLEALDRALSFPLNEEENIGFLRGDALLVAIVLTNENDFSKESIEDYIHKLNVLKPPLPHRPQSWIFNFVGVTGTNDEDCTTYGDYSSVGKRYMELVKYSRGVSSTICTAVLRETLANVHRVILRNLTEIFLNRIPTEGTLVVRFDGQIVPESEVDGWTYHAETNSIQFHGDYIPTKATEIQITFDPTLPK